MSASLHTSPTCRAQVLQQSQPSISWLTPGGQLGGAAGHSQGHLQYCVRLYGSSVVVGAMEVVVVVVEVVVVEVVVTMVGVAGGMAVEFWEKAC